MALRRSFSSSLLLPSPVTSRRLRTSRARACKGPWAAPIAEASSVASCDKRINGEASVETLESFFRFQREQYLRLNPTSKRCLDLVQKWQTQHDGSPVSFDHLAFRTFSTAGGISSIASFLLDFGYSQRDFLQFPKKKLRAFWFSPPSNSLPRVFVSELAVEELSSEAQAVLGEYTHSTEPWLKHSFPLSILRPTPWPCPTSSHYSLLKRESEYAAWTLVNGYSLNHTTISVHHLAALGVEEGTGGGAIERLNSILEQGGIQLNQEGGKVKVSPDGLLLQSSTVADAAPFHFSDGVSLHVPLSYIEFALRLLLPQYAHIPTTKVEECHRREGFEVGNADGIFESTSSTQGQMQSAGLHKSRG